MIVVYVVLGVLLLLSLRGILSYNRFAGQRNLVIESWRQVDVELTVGVDRLLAIAEAYPLLQADRLFGDLQHELVDTEDRIASSRRLYNGNVRALNTRVETFPSSVTARLMRIKPSEYFEADAADRAVPSTEFA